MIRFQEVPRPARVGTALIGVAGMLALAGCSTTPAAQNDGMSTESAASAAPSTGSTGSTTDAAASGSSYADGSYTAKGSYSTPESVEQITVKVTLAADVITAVDVIGQPQKSESKQYQSQFIGGISDVVVGKKIDEISVSRVAGSSLTSSGFNQAIEEIKSEAAA